jgi:hypothetical protein
LESDARHVPAPVSLALQPAAQMPAWINFLQRGVYTPMKSNRCKFHLVWIVISTSLAGAQQPRTIPGPPELRLSMTASQTESHGLPHLLTLKITNITRHDILIPTPTNCSDGMYGTLFFSIDIQRKTGPAPLGMGCVADYNFTNVSISDRIKKWKRLLPGQSLVFNKNVTAEIGAILRGPPEPGRYEFRASYEPPWISEHDKILLTTVRIGFPHDTMRTPSQAFIYTAERPSFR